MDTLSPGSKQTIALRGLTDVSVTPNAAINNAVVTATLYDPAGAPVANLNAVALAYVAASAGDYVYAIPAADTAGLLIGKVYHLQYLVTVGGVLQDTINRSVAITERTS